MNREGRTTHGETVTSPHGRGACSLSGRAVAAFAADGAAAAALAAVVESPGQTPHGPAPLRAAPPAKALHLPGTSEAAPRPGDPLVPLAVDAGAAPRRGGDGVPLAVEATLPTAPSGGSATSAPVGGARPAAAEAVLPAATPELAHRPPVAPTAGPVLAETALPSPRPPVAPASVPEAADSPVAVPRLRPAPRGIDPAIVLRTAPDGAEAIRYRLLRADLRRHGDPSVLGVVAAVSGAAAANLALALAEHSCSVALVELAAREKPIWWLLDLPPPPLLRPAPPAIGPRPGARDAGAHADEDLGAVLAEYGLWRVHAFLRLDVLVQARAATTAPCPGYGPEGTGDGPAPQEPALDAGALVAALRRRYRYVVLDLPPGRYGCSGVDRFLLGPALGRDPDTRTMPVHH